MTDPPRGPAEFSLPQAGDMLSGEQGDCHMNRDILSGNWKQIRGKVQAEWGRLTDDDLDVIEGRQTELVGRLQERYGLARDEAEKQVDRFLKPLH